MAKNASIYAAFERMWSHIVNYVDNAGVLYVNVNGNDRTTDVLYSEIKEAYDAGRSVVARFTGGYTTDDGITVTLEGEHIPLLNFSDSSYTGPYVAFRRLEAEYSVIIAITQNGVFNANCFPNPYLTDVVANDVTFDDGETFQQKYDSGELTGPAGANGQPGTAGRDATINGVNALTLTTGMGLSGSQSGNTYTLSLTSHNQAASTITDGTFAGQVVAKSDAQTPGTKLIRNSKLMAASDFDAVTDWSTHITNGEIVWRYE